MSTIKQIVSLEGQCWRQTHLYIFVFPLHYELHVPPRIGAK